MHGFWLFMLGLYVGVNLAVPINAWLLRRREDG
jgi:hypothetical protein